MGRTSGIRCIRSQWTVFNNFQLVSQLREDWVSHFCSKWADNPRDQRCDCYKWQSQCHNAGTVKGPSAVIPWIIVLPVAPKWLLNLLSNFNYTWERGKGLRKKNYPPAESMENQQEKRKGEQKQHTHQGKSWSMCSKVICSTCCWLIKADVAPHQPQHKVLLAQGHRSKPCTAEKEQREAWEETKTRSDCEEV